MPQFIPLSAVRVTEPFWKAEQRLVREVVLPYQWDILNDRAPGAQRSGCIHNFRVAAGLEEGQRVGTVFLDTDLYKWMEAVAYCLAAQRDPALEALADGAVELIAKAQEADGYLDTYYTLVAPGRRWTNLMEGHELYCAGHFIEAAVAYAEATGKRLALEVAMRLADCVDAAFGPEEGKLRGYAGHPEVELALVRLYDFTGCERYLRLARHFVDARGADGGRWFQDECAREGHQYIWWDMSRFGPDYFQAQAPVREQRQAVGHAVRAMYLYCAMADLARIGGDAGLRDACGALYDSVTKRRMYVTGGIGSCAFGERFTSDFDLPVDSAYAETCASVGLMMFARRMYLLTGDARYYDGWERALRNTVLAGMGGDGRHFFYVNPLEVVPDIANGNPTLEHVKTVRQEWFGVACCPPNIARALSSLGGSLYATDGDRLIVLAHIASAFHTDAIDGELRRDGDDYTLTVDAPPMTIELRRPEGFAFEGESRIRHAGGKATYRYCLMPLTRLVRADPRVPAVAGRACVVRGQTVYCLEQADNGAALGALWVPSDARFAEKPMDFLPDGLPALTCQGYRARALPSGALYCDEPPRLDPATLTFVPYSHWNNRGEGEMRVWVNETLRPEN